jgi:hypothetical protein
MNLSNLAKTGKVIMEHARSSIPSLSHDKYRIYAMNDEKARIVDILIHSSDLAVAVGDVMADYLRGMVENGRYMYTLSPVEVMGLRGTFGAYIENNWTDKDSLSAFMQGWDLFSCDSEMQLQSADESKVFESDDAAVAFVKMQAASGDVLAKKAIAVLIVSGSSDVARYSLNSQDDMDAANEQSLSQEIIDDILMRAKKYEFVPTADTSLNLVKESASLLSIEIKDWNKAAEMLLDQFEEMQDVPD